MRKQQLLWKLSLALICLILMGGTLACQEEPSGPRAWIDFPLDGSSVPVGTAVTVLSHVYAREGVAEVLLSVNGEAYRRSPPAQPGDSFSKVSQEWFPQQEGDYVLQVKAYSQNGAASNPATIRVRAIGKGMPTPTSVAPLARTVTPERVTPLPVGAADLAIVSVEAVVAGDKGGVPFCNTRVTYRNAGTVAVPRDFSIQFYFDGALIFTNSVAGGLGPGATDQITFIYQFVDLHYIGINLDSTNVIAESDETNNAFAEIRRCGGAPATVTSTPTIPLLHFITPTPTRTPTIPPPPPTCSGTPNILSFYAYPPTISQGQSTTLNWGTVTNADWVSIEPGIGGVATPGSATVSPNTTTTYTLTARCGSNTATRQTTVTVTSPPPPATHTPTRTRTRTPTTPPDTTPPPAPQQVSPSGTLSCRSSVTLDWNAVSDPSGIKTYYVKLERQITQGNWQSAGGWTTSSTAQSVPVQCGGIYRWQVRAEDNAGNVGPWSGMMNFSISLP